MKNKLNSIYDLRKQLDEMIDTREALYHNVHSPLLTGGSRSNIPSDPTAKTANRIIQLDERIEVLKKKYNAAAAEALEWLYNIDPDEMRNISQFRSIILCHYLRGMSWKETARRTMKSACEGAPKRSVGRYFQDHPAE